MARVKDEAAGAAAYVPFERSISNLREAAKSCQGCDLYKDATQTVFGEGPASASIVMVGEQPGDSEDQEGAPFVGPAGHVLDRALADLGVARSDLYVTNAVKHFKWIPKGKRRIHQTPRASEIRACHAWLEAEVEAITPKLIVCLGSVAVQSLLGPKTKLLVNRGKVIESDFGPCLITVHPSSILRVDSPSDREAAYEAFVADLQKGLTFLQRAAV